MSKRWYKEHKKEHYYRTAKKLKYRSRAVFKLKQINEKFAIISKGNNVVDLGAAPGGWSQAAVEMTGEGGKIIAVDLDHITPLPGVIFIRGDMRDDNTVGKVAKEMQVADVVVSDMSPNISGIYSLDQARSYELAMCTLEFSRKVLKHNGNMITKIFEGEDFNTFLGIAKRAFGFVKPYSPKASRSTSSEVYVICKGAKWSSPRIAAIATAEGPAVKKDTAGPRA